NLDAVPVLVSRTRNILTEVSTRSSAGRGCHSENHRGPVRAPETLRDDVIGEGLARDQGDSFGRSEGHEVRGDGGAGKAGRASVREVPFAIQVRGDGRCGDAGRADAAPFLCPEEE